MIRSNKAAKLAAFADIKATLTAYKNNNQPFDRLYISQPNIEAVKILTKLPSLTVSLY